MDWRPCECGGATCASQFAAGGRDDGVFEFHVECYGESVSARLKPATARALAAEMLARADEADPAAGGDK